MVILYLSCCCWEIQYKLINFSSSCSPAISKPLVACGVAKTAINKHIVTFKPGDNVIREKSTSNPLIVVMDEVKGSLTLVVFPTNICTYGLDNTVFFYPGKKFHYWRWHYSPTLYHGNMCLYTKS